MGNKSFYLIWVFIFTSSCGFNNVGVPDQSCKDGWFDKKERIGSYAAKPIPNLRIGIGDTLWFDHNSFWDSSEDCDEGYGRLEIQWLLGDSEVVVPILSNTEIGLISRGVGESTVHIVGEVKLRRNDEDIERIVTQSFEVVVLEGHETEQISSYVDPPIYEIEDILIEVKYHGGLNNFTVEVVGTSFLKENELGRVFIHYTPNTINSELVEDLFLWSRSKLDKAHDIQWDSSYASITGLAKIHNPEGIQFTNGIGNYTGRYFEIHSSPIDVPVSERTFEVSFFND